MNNLTFGDSDMGYYETIAGGAGAGPDWDGRSGVHTHMTNTRITDPGDTLLPGPYGCKGDEQCHHFPSCQRMSINTWKSMAFRSRRVNAAVARRDSGAAVSCGAAGILSAARLWRTRPAQRRRWGHQGGRDFISQVYSRL